MPTQSEVAGHFVLQQGTNAWQPLLAESTAYFKALAENSETEVVRCLQLQPELIDAQLTLLYWGTDPACPSVASKASVNVKHRTALMVAAQCGSADVIRLLLQLGADPSVKSSDDGMTALQVRQSLAMACVGEAPGAPFPTRKGKGPAPESPRGRSRTLHASLMRLFLLERVLPSHCTWEGDWFCSALSRAVNRIVKQVEMSCMRARLTFLCMPGVPEQHGGPVAALASLLTPAPSPACRSPTRWRLSTPRWLPRCSPPSSRQTLQSLRFSALTHLPAPLRAQLALTLHSRRSGSRR
jgi:hypothetical protein